MAPTNKFNGLEVMYMKKENSNIQGYLLRIKEFSGLKMLLVKEYKKNEMDKSRCEC